MTEEITKTIPKGISEENYNAAKEIIVSGFQADQDADAIKTAMFSNGIPFSQLVRLFKHITIAEGLVRDPKEIRKEIAEAVNEYDFTAETTWEGIEEVVNEIKEKVKGATEKKITSQIRNVMEDDDLQYPKKPRSKKGGAGRTSKVNAAIVDYFNDNDQEAYSAEGFTAALAEVTTEKSVKKWARLYKTFAAVANGLDSKEGLK